MEQARPSAPLPVSPQLWRHPVLREWLVIALLLSMFTLFSLRGEWFSRIEQTAYDQALSLWQRPAQSDIVIVGIDDDSIQQLGRWPWPRVVHAKLLEKLTEADVKAVALDIVLSEPDKQDQLLADAVRANGKVVLPLKQKINEGVTVGEALPTPLLAAAAARLAHISATFDSDGVVRRTFLRAGFRAPRHDLLAVATLDVAEPDRVANIAVLRDRLANPPLSDTAVWSSEREYQIPFAGGSPHFKQVSYIDILRGDVPIDVLKNKIILVGATAAGTGDEFPTPLSGDGSTNASGQSREARAMPGIEIHANIIQGLREGINIREAPFATTATISLILVLGLLAAFLWLSPSQSIILTASSCVIVIVGAALLFRLGQLWISPVVAFMAMVLAYPLWSWRKLQATQRYFDEELSRLQSERSVVSPEAAKRILPQFAAAAFMPDVVEQRIASVRDATQRLRNLNRFVADSLESLPEAALVTDFNGRVMLANSSADRLFGFSKLPPATNDNINANIRLSTASDIEQPLEGRDVFELMRSFKHDSDKSWRELWADASENSRTISIEARVANQTVGKAADDLEYLVQIAPSMSHTGVHTGTILTLTDISPLRESERRRDEALRFLSHDMRSPQASIITLLEMQRDDPESMSFEKLMERIDRYAKRTLNLADDFLRLAKAERSKPQDFAPLELSGLLQDAVEEAWSLASAKRISVKSNTPEDDAWVSGDRDLLTRVLMNLLSNAIKYSPPNTTVTCSLRREDKNWVIDVADQGYGISEANMSKLFTRFVRLHEEGQPEEEGIGLGLVFVKTVVTRHNGSIGVKSRVARYGAEDANAMSAVESTDHGTTFSVTLPVQDAPED
jgi:CHASE2 domain-containing sensor protein/signal transduction histidine kinase